jgi:hypothetical protein
MCILDGVRVKDELIRDFTPRILSMRKHFFPRAKEFNLQSDEPIDSDDVTTTGVSTIRLFTE